MFSNVSLLWLINICKSECIMSKFALSLLIPLRSLLSNVTYISRERRGIRGDTGNFMHNTRTWRWMTQENVCYLPSVIRPLMLLNLYFPLLLLITQNTRTDKFISSIFSPFTESQVTQGEREKLSSSLSGVAYPSSLCFFRHFLFFFSD